MTAITCPQQDAVLELAELLDCELTIHDRNNHAAIRRLKGTIHNKQIAIVDTEIRHGLTFHPDEERGFGVLDQVFVETQPLLVVIGGR